MARTNLESLFDKDCHYTLHKAFQLMFGEDKDRKDELKDRLASELDHYKEVSFGDLIHPVDKDEKERPRKRQKARNSEGLISSF